MENIDWSNLGFGYIKTDYNLRSNYADGKWSSPEATTDEFISIHMAAPSLHYGTEAFEGLKAFMGADGKIRIFRPADNARRMIATANRLCMQAPDEELFVKACIEAVRLNKRFIPPYGTGASLYIRPLLIGTGAVLGIHPAENFLFAVFVSPVGAYFKGGMTLIDVMVDTEYDRAAPRGTGAIKCGGNYAASLYPGEIAHKMGYSNVLYLDPLEHKYVEECGAANFFGIKDGRYITPESDSILPSITNMSLRTLAADMGLKVEQRKVEFSEIDTFDECGACGTAAVISPIGSIYNPDTDIVVKYGEDVGFYSKAMYEKLQDIQYGRCDDPYGWTVVVE